ncbi:MAG: sialidase [Candidatus Brocadiia bacterium]|nr:MAG: sialidase [Candidatus Brocadiia bacterium]
MKVSKIISLVVLFLSASSIALSAAQCCPVTAPSLREGLMKQPGIVEAQFLYMKASFPSCHASTIEETKDYFISAYFGGTGEGNEDVCIWVSRKKKDAKQWDVPVMAADGIQSPGVAGQSDKAAKRYPCWNPVLYQDKAANGKFYLFYKVGPSPDNWWGMLKVSDDQGKSWSQGSRLPDGFAGPVRAKPVMLDDGRLLCPSSNEDKGWRSHMEWTPDFGKTWFKTEPLNDGKAVRSIQPTILTFKDGRIEILTRSKQNKIYKSWSNDGGKTWSELVPSVLPNPNSGIDAVRLKDGRHLLVYNHSDSRKKLNVAVTEDGESWKAALKLEDLTTIEGNDAYGAYPAAILGSDGLVHIVYTWKRQRINYVVVDPAKLVLRDMPDGNWPD